MRLPFALVELAGAPAPRQTARWDVVEDAIARARDAGARLVVFPECALTGYAPWGPDPRLDVAATRDTLAARARAAGVHVILGWDAGDRCTLALATPDGAVHTYEKQHPTPTEARRWQRGGSAGIVPTAFGRVGLLVCADVLHRRAWEGLRGRVDLVVVAAAWPDYAGRLARLPPPLRPLARPVTEGSGPWRDRLLARAATSLGVPVVICDARGPLRAELPATSEPNVEGFRAASAAWDGHGAPLPLEARPGTGDTGGSILVGHLVPGGTRRDAQAPDMEPDWRAFAGAYDGVARLRAALSRVFGG